MPLSFRLDPRTRSQLSQLARQSGLTQSAIIREALDRLVRDRAAVADADRPYDAIAHLVGCVRGGSRNLSSKTGERFREMLSARRRRR